MGTPLSQKWFRRGPLRAAHGIPSSTEGILTETLSKDFRLQPRLEWTFLLR